MSVCDQLDADVRPYNMPRELIPYCGAPSPQGYLCTRTRGHGGDHHAHGCSPQEDGDCIEVWQNNNQKE